MNDIYFYKPDDKIKYINECDLWVIARLVDVVNEKKEVKQWMEPFWLSTSDQKGIAIFVSRLDAEILVQYMQRNNERWKVYPLNIFDIKEMMVNCKKLTNNSRYNFIYSFGFWSDSEGNLINKKYCLSQCLAVEGFTVDSRYEGDEDIVIRFSKETLNFIYSCWNNKVSDSADYRKYLESVNELDDVICKKEAILALENINSAETNRDFNPDIATIWSMPEQKWIYSNLNNPIN